MLFDESNNIFGELAQNDTIGWVLPFMLKLRCLNPGSYGLLPIGLLDDEVPDHRPQAGPIRPGGAHPPIKGLIQGKVGRHGVIRVRRVGLLQYRLEIAELGDLDGVTCCPGAIRPVEGRRAVGQLGVFGRRLQSRRHYRSFEFP